jgi:hypothetical protein
VVNGGESGEARRKAKEGVKMPTLESELDELIARQENVRPDQVTLELIREKRETEVYPNARVDFSTNYGGHIATGRFYGLTEAKATIEKAYKFLTRFSKRK